MAELDADVKSACSPRIRGVLAHYWHPVSWAHELGKGPKPTTLLGRRLVLWRDAGGLAHAADDQCPHRGTALSLGTVDGDGCLVCPYHGWTFAPAGQATVVPQLPRQAPVPPRARVAVHRCTELYGLVWVALAEPAAPVACFPEWGDPGYRHVPCDAYTWECGAARMVENFTDFGHLGYLHDGLLGTRDDLEVPPHRVESDGAVLRYALTMAVPNTNDRFAVTDVKGARGMQTNTYELTLPYTIHLQCTYHDTGAHRTLYFAVQPRSAHQATGYCYQSRDFDLDAPPGPFNDFQSLLAEQDRPVVESQLPLELPLDANAELQLPFDRVAVAYRRGLKGLLEPPRCQPGTDVHALERPAADSAGVPAW
jgi:phenylpropionate dioxygenase-like ring-hydroxylating dioxygenase large terminal subunit